ncbi:MAG: APC family permease [Pseudomonadota bacterium]
MSSRSLLPQTLRERAWHFLLGRPRDFHDPSLGHKLSLAAFLAWVGLGVDGLSSSAYGPDEAYRALGEYSYLAVLLAVATTFTVFVISYAYSRLIEHFPHGGGGYVVATQLLGKPAGVVSGCALLVDYVFTITVSIAGGGDAVFSLLPISLQFYKLPTEFLAIFFLVVMNLRGVKESVKVVLPFFLLFVATHLVLILGGISVHVREVPALIGQTHDNLRSGIGQIGTWGLFLVFLRAYSMGGGTYTGIEAISNGVGTLEEPRIQTGRRTMLYLAASLSLTAAGLFICYMLFGVRPVEGQTLNAVLANAFAAKWNLFGLPVGSAFVVITMFSESVLLLIAAQTGFIDGPRVMANMALDSWLPKRFASLSDRLTIQNGIHLMGLAALLMLIVTGGHIGILVVMYSINVFITFSTTEISMIRFWITSRKKEAFWKRNLLIHSTGFLLCFTILCVMVIEKFAQGAWATLVVTGACLAVCITIWKHYRRVGQRIQEIERRVDLVGEALPTKTVPAFDPAQPTAAILVGGSNRLGLRSLLAALRSFPGSFHNVVFLSVGQINSEYFREGAVRQLENGTETMLKAYAETAKKMGFPTKYAFRVGTDVVQEASELCVEISRELRNVVFFAGEIVFQKPRWFDRFLHNDTAIAIQRHIRYAGLPMVILPLVLGDGVGST